MNRLRRKSQVLTTQCVRQGCFSRHYDESLILICPLIFHELFNSIRTGPYPGPVMICMNTFLFIVQLIWGRSLIGIGTVANMTLIGFTSDFCTGIWQTYLPDMLFTAQPERIIIFIIALAGFLISAALYMNSESGLARYDDLTVMISNALHIPSMQYVFPQSRQEL